MTKLSAKMHLLVIISSVIIALGIAIGLVCQFVGNGFFNYSGEYATKNTITVNYALADVGDNFNKDVIEDVCNSSFKVSGLNVTSKTYADTLQGGEIVYSFSENVKYEELTACVNSIKEQLGLNSDSTSGLSNVTANYEKAVINNGKDILTCGIALIAVVAVQFIYYCIRYKWTMALGALTANVHNLALYLALVAITRVQVSSSIIAFAALTVMATVIGTAYLFDKMRKAQNSEENKKSDVSEICDLVAYKCIKPLTVVFAALAIATVLIAVLTILGSLSLTGLLMPALCAIISFVATLYGTAIFTPSVYSRYARLANSANS